MVKWNLTKFRLMSLTSFTVVTKHRFQYSYYSKSLIILLTKPANNVLRKKKTQHTEKHITKDTITDICCQV